MSCPVIPTQVTTSAWASSSYIGYSGELLTEITPSGERKLKIGNGLDLFGDLPYASGGGVESPDMIQAWTDAYGPCTGYEFDDLLEVPPAGWSWVNQGGSTYRERLGAGVISMPSSGSSNAIRGIVMDVPSVPFSVEGKFSLTHNTADFQEAGLILRESSSGELAMFSRNNTPSWVRSFWNSPSSYASGTTTAAQQSESFYLRLTVNSWSNVTYEVSINGVSWTTFATGVNVGATLTPDQIGFGGNSTASRAIQPACHWLRVTTL